MSDELKELKELKRLAEAATPGPWRSMWGARKANPLPKDMYFHVSATAPAIPGFCGERSVELASITKLYGDTDFANASYIAATNPATILKLLAELEQAKADAALLLNSLGEMIGCFEPDSSAIDIKLAIANARKLHAALQSQEVKS